jgi:hypothetical protein
LPEVEVEKKDSTRADEGVGENDENSEGVLQKGMNSYVMNKKNPESNIYPIA